MKLKAIYTLPIKRQPSFAYRAVGWVARHSVFEADSPTDQAGLDSAPCWVRLASGGWVCVTTEAGVKRATLIESEAG